MSKRLSGVRIKGQFRDTEAGSPASVYNMKNAVAAVIPNALFEDTMTELPTNPDMIDIIDRSIRSGCKGVPMVGIPEDTVYIVPRSKLTIPIMMGLKAFNSYIGVENLEVIKPHKWINFEDYEEGMNMIWNKDYTRGLQIVEPKWEIIKDIPISDMTSGLVWVYDIRNDPVSAILNSEEFSQIDRQYIKDMTEEQIVEWAERYATITGIQIDVKVSYAKLDNVDNVCVALGISTIEEV